MKGKAAENFEELLIYQRARELTNGIYQACRASEFQHDRALVDQIRRAAVSIMSNIAEGLERGTKTEFLQFLFIAKGPCGEVRAQMQFALDQKYIFLEEHPRLNDLARRTSGMISNFIAHLQRTDYQGEKFAHPQRLANESAEKRQQTLRTAQLANIRREQNHSASANENPSHSSNPSHQDF